MKKAVQSEHSMLSVYLIWFASVFELLLITSLYVLFHYELWLMVILLVSFVAGWIFLMLIWNRKWVKVEITDKRVECSGLILPFIRKVIWEADAEYFVTREYEYENRMHHCILLIKSGKIIADINTDTMKNAQEVMDALPWPNRGRYVPEFSDSLKPGTINEAFIRGK